MKAQYIEISEYGSKFYHSDKEMTIYHREDGPAFENKKGYKAWYLNGKLHREDGPAVKWVSAKYWYLNGFLHRKDGPAFERSDGYKEWHLNGNKYSEKEFNEKMNPVPKININGKEFTIEELNNLIAKD